MKKIIALLVTIFCLFSVPVSALALTPSAIAVEDESGKIPLSPNASITLDGGYTDLYYDGEYYVNFNVSNIITSGYEDLDCLVYLNGEQQELKSTSFKINFERNIIMAEYEFNNGNKLSINYIKQNDYYAFGSFDNTEWYVGQIDFVWPEDNKVDAMKSSLTGTATILDVSSNKVSNEFDVCVTIVNGVKSKVGELLLIGDEYYYLDFESAGIFYDEYFDINEYTDIYLYKVIDEKLCSDIELAMKRYYDDDYGFLEDGNFTKVVSDVLLVIIFGIVPFGVAVIFIIMAIRSKTYYKKFFRAIYISSLFVLAIFIALTLIL